VTKSAIVRNCSGGHEKREPNMRIALKRNYVERANGAARGLLWLLLGVCVIAATLYDLSGIVR
jgi:hypothetical protein